MKTILFICASLLLIPASAVAQKQGDWVLARWNGGEYWFSGVVQSGNDKSVTVAYDDGAAEMLSRNKVKPYDWKTGSRIECRWAGGSAWYAAHITSISKEGSRLDVKYDEDGVREHIATGGCRSR